MSQNGNSTKISRRRGGPATAEGRRNQIASRTSYGVRATAPVLAGIEDPQEWEKFLAGFLDVWNPVGQHEFQCTLGIADGYWRLGRVRRYVSQTTVGLLLEAALDEPEEVQRQIEKLTRAHVIRRSAFGGIEVDEEKLLSETNNEIDPFTRLDHSPSVAWWQKILSGSDVLELTRTETGWLLTYVTVALLDDDDEDDHDKDDENASRAADQQPVISLPDRAITLGELRAQLAGLQNAVSAHGNGRPSVSDVLSAGYKAALQEAELTRLALLQAHRFIAAHLLLPDPTITTAQVYERQILCGIARHMNTLERLQARRAGQLIPPPVSVDVIVTSSKEDSI